MSRLTMRIYRADQPGLTIGQKIDLTVRAVVVALEADLVRVGPHDALPGEMVTVTLEATLPPSIDPRQ